MIFGYVGRKDYVDSTGPRVAAGHGVHHAAGARWWTWCPPRSGRCLRQLKKVGGTPDPEGLPLRRAWPRIHGLLYGLTEAELSRALKLASLFAAHPCWDATNIDICGGAPGQRHGHRRHGRWAGSRRGPGVPGRLRADAWCDSSVRLWHSSSGVPPSSRPSRSGPGPQPAREPIAAKTLPAEPTRAYPRS